jgi:hypothetical protein
MDFTEIGLKGVARIDWCRTGTGGGLLGFHKICLIP